MIKDIVKDEEFLKIPGVKATVKDKQVAIDLLDTLEHHSDSCVGLAANMIGHSLNIIAVNIHQTLVVMYNPVIVEKHDPYETEEGCLSLDGVRKTTRYKSIVVESIGHKFNNKSTRLSGLSAQIVQHEVYHLHGIII